MSCQSFLAWTLWINVICKRPDKEVYQLKNQGCEKKKKKRMIVAPQLYSAAPLFTAQYAAFIGPSSCFFFCFFSEWLIIYRDAWVDIPFSVFNCSELIVSELPVFSFLGRLCCLYTLCAHLNKQSTKPRDKNKPTTIACDICLDRTLSYATTSHG